MASIEFTPPGGADEGFKMLIHKPTVASTLAAGYTLEEGDGTELPIWFNEDGFGPRNAGGHKSIFKSLATAARSVEIADSSGRLSPALTSRLAADAFNSTNVMSDSGFPPISLEANSLYEIQARLIVQSAATTTGVWWRLMGPAAQTDYICYGSEIIFQNAASTITWGTIYAPTATWIAGAPLTGSIVGVVKTGAVTPVLPVTLDFQSEVNGSQVAIRAGSVIRFTKL
jgi:hypothetical protein